MTMTMTIQHQRPTGGRKKRTLATALEVGVLGREPSQSPPLSSSHRPSCNSVCITFSGTSPDRSSLPIYGSHGVASGNWNRHLGIIRTLNYNCTVHRHHSESSISSIPFRKDDPRRRLVLSPT